jgi:hypothetical protein
MSKVVTEWVGHFGTSVHETQAKYRLAQRIACVEYYVIEAVGQ